jgi:glycosyltransferase involved in cell wall biosynthesis
MVKMNNYKSNNKSVTFIKSNTKEITPRVSKEISALLQEGYFVTLLCWRRNPRELYKIPDEKNLNYNEIQFKFRAPFTIKILPFLPFWWIFELYWLLKLNSDIIHAIDFDTIVPATIASKLKQSILIYEMYDVYEDHRKLPQFIRNVCVKIDKIFMHVANAVIVVDENRINELNGIPNKNTLILINSPPDVIEKSILSNKNKSKMFTVFYAGSISKNRSLKQVISAIQTIDNVKLILAGYGDLVPEIIKLSNKNPKKIQFLGKISYSEVINFSVSANLLFSLYNPDIPLFKYSSSNKLYEAMMCGRPILVNNNTSMDNIVRNEKCGIVVNYGNINEIRNSIIRLKNDQQLCIRLGENGRKAYEEKYNWEIMKKRLINIYNELIDVN